MEIVANGGKMMVAPTPLPSYLLGLHIFDRSDRYYHRNGYLYQVDPMTMLVEQVISALLR